MSKNKTPQQPPQVALSEASLMKTLLDMEQEALRKGGDPLQQADPEGGFATEGQPLSGKAGGQAAKGGDAMSSSEPPDDDVETSSPEDEDTSKSLRQRAEAGGKGAEELRKGLRVNEFLDEFLTNASDVLEDASVRIEKAIQDMAQDDLGFRVKLAKSFMQMGGMMVGQQDLLVKQQQQIDGLNKAVGELLGLVKAMANQPFAPQRPMVVQPNQVVQPPLGASLGAEPQGDPNHPLPIQVRDFLWAKSERNEIRMGQELMAVTLCEQNGYDYRYLMHGAPQLFKALVTDLQKSSAS